MSTDARLTNNTGLIIPIISRLRGAASSVARLRRLLSRQPVPSAVARWALTWGGALNGDSATIEGGGGGYSWRLEHGEASRDYVSGSELRGRAEIGCDPSVAVVIIERELKAALERRAYSMITDTLQTTARPQLSEEMRWLAMYNEVGWDGASSEFWTRYAVLSTKREHAMSVVDAKLVDLLQQRALRVAPAVPFVLALMRGRCYLVSECPTEHSSNLHAATSVFLLACENAVQSLAARASPNVS